MKIKKMAGDGQKIMSGKFSEELALRVSDDDGNVANGVKTVWNVRSGSVVIDVSQDQTTIHGLNSDEPTAQSSCLLLADQPGPYEITCTVKDKNGRHLTAKFRGEVIPVASEDTADPDVDDDVPMANPADVIDVPGEPDGLPLPPIITSVEPALPVITAAVPDEIDAVLAAHLSDTEEFPPPVPTIPDRIMRSSMDQQDQPEAPTAESAGTETAPMTDPDVQPEPVTETDPVPVPTEMSKTDDTALAPQPPEPPAAAPSPDALPQSDVSQPVPDNDTIESESFFQEDEPTETVAAVKDEKPEPLPPSMRPARWLAPLIVVAATVMIAGLFWLMSAGMRQSAYGLARLAFQSQPSIAAPAPAAVQRELVCDRIVRVSADRNTVTFGCLPKK